MKFRLLAATIALLFAAVPVMGQDAETHLTIGHDLSAEISRHWTLPSGLVLSVRVTDEQDRTISGSCADGSCMIDGPNAAADLVEVVEEGVQSIGVGAGYSRELSKGGVNLTAQVAATYTSDRGITGLEAIPAGVSGLAEIRLTKDSYVGFVGFQVRDQYQGGFGPNVLPLLDKDAGHWRAGLGIRF